MAEEKQNWDMTYYMTNLTEAEANELLDRIIEFAEAHGGVVVGAMGVAKEADDEQSEAVTAM
jgi:hypothetical protein